ncbi:MAG TPA: imidazoleglycerol-phosphate dehydratase HisB [Methanoregulaceae archaeon]|nr:MAG: imidazoleglycerol-phosphate dehydratase HisB [Methanolinea sp.]HON81421.1 imidazoleglycerol-phosphate dehydratase HisB [Methanoregulaceae archaeon]HPD10051.1 imidazoleglycerol-phosphate dehydratase HisB [Methanoregulaceae archaeon]HRT15057.1 imidazoleglycerol-phosphate dehydratase HisB [Methanoregulaceae archaeon]HRU30628.1 imidazoleglycerol-phosphate dehydratase HisB [Methanoregulaceae archaeon]
MRIGEISRTTRETDISVWLALEGTGIAAINTSLPFLDHMLEAMTRHGRFDLTCTATGDLHVDAHHTVEDLGIVLGEAIRKAVGDGRGIRRFAHAIVPMDESLATVALDCGGRSYLVYQGCFSAKKIGGIENDVFEHFFHSLCTKAGLNAHILFHGRNDHHQCEAVFKAFGIALSGAVQIVEGISDIPSTKGVL